MARILNLGIVAHVDAGKTSLTERLLYFAGVIDELGTVDDGNTQTDSLALERQRGITIKSAVASFAVGDVTVNLIDTPGHPDLIAEVERALRVLDGVVLVISAVEGVQAQTRVLLRTLRRLRVPTLLFVNKIDRPGARYGRLLREIAERLTPAFVAMGTVSARGTPQAAFVPYDAGAVVFTSRLAEILADNDEALLAAYVDDEVIPYRRLRRELAQQTAQTLVYPVFFGSAVTGAGIGDLVAALTELLPVVAGDPRGPVSGVVFKVDRGRAGEKVAYVRMYSGTLRVRDRVSVGRGEGEKVTAIGVIRGGSALPAASVSAGQIGKLSGLGEVRIGDPVGVPPPIAGEPHLFATPTLETVVLPRRRTDRAALHTALTQLAEQDPFIDLRWDEVREELAVSLYGEVQKEVIQATLVDEYGIEVDFQETTTVYIERPLATGAAAEFIFREPNPFMATVGLRLEPAPVGTGVTVRLDVPVESIPMYVYHTVEDFRTALEGIVRGTLRQGLYGWRVADCLVTLTHSDYQSPGTNAVAYRRLVPLVVMSALQRAGTVVCEPVHRFHVEAPADTLNAVLGTLARLGAVAQGRDERGTTGTLTGLIAAGLVRELELRLPQLTHGEGILESTFDRYEPVRGIPPSRPRWDDNPLDRAQYLLRVERRVAIRRDRA